MEIEPPPIHLHTAAGHAVDKEANGDMDENDDDNGADLFRGFVVSLAKTPDETRDMLLNGLPEALSCLERVLQIFCTSWFLQ